jgi:tetratricopeptide (TPR) repeat protein
MPRSEQPLADAGGVLGQFAAELRQLRERAGSVPYRQLARRCHYSASALSEAANGRKLPSLSLTLAYARACGGDVAEWETRWHEVNAALAADAANPANPADVPAAPGLVVDAVAPATLGQLPPREATFTGRGAELDTLADLLAAGSGAGVVVVTAVAGLAGVGKTALAVQAAHAAVRAELFPGGVLFVDLHGYGDAPVGADQALESLLRGLGVPAERIPPDPDGRAALYRSRLAERAGAVLVLVDNVASVEQVRPLVPADDRHRVLLTSRHTLPGLGARLLDLAVLAPAEAIELLESALRAADPDDGRISVDPVAAGELIRYCGYLPLALHMAAALLVTDPDQSVAELADELADAASRLSRLDDGDRGVRAAFDLSHQRLPPEQAMLFQYLGLHPGPEITAPVAAVLTDAASEDMRTDLRQLARAHMLERTGVRGRWRMHDLLGAYARTLAGRLPKDEHQDATGRLLEYYLHATRAADLHLTPGPHAVPHEETPPPEDSVAAALPRPRDRAEAMGWLEAERANLHACVAHAAATGHPGRAVRIAQAAASFLDQAGHWRQAQGVHRIAFQAACLTGDRPAQVRALNDLGHAQQRVDEYGEATENHTRALELAKLLDDRGGQAVALTHLGRKQHATGQYGEAIEYHTQALALYRELGDRHGQTAALNDLGRVQYLTGQYAVAIESYTQALELCRQLEDRPAEADTLHQLGRAQWRTGRNAAAVDSLTQALRRHQRLGDRRGQAAALTYLGAVHHATGQYAEAIGHHTRALELHRELGDRHGEAATLDYLGQAQQFTGAYERAADSLTQALELARRLGDPGGEVETLNHYAALVAVTVTPARGRELHERALRLAREIDAGKDEADALAGIAATYQAEGRADEADAWYRRALTLYQEMDCTTDVARVQAALDDR